MKAVRSRNVGGQFVTMIESAELWRRCNNTTRRRCRCWKWILGTVPGRLGSMRASAKTRTWEQAESLARKYEIADVGGDKVKGARSLPTLKGPVNGYLADAEARDLAPVTIQKLQDIFKKQLLAFAEQQWIVFLRDVNVRNMTEWRSTWSDKTLARIKQIRTCRRILFVLRASWLAKGQSQATMRASALPRSTTLRGSVPAWINWEKASSRLGNFGQSAAKSDPDRKTIHCLR